MKTIYKVFLLTIAAVATVHLASGQPSTVMPRPVSVDPSGACSVFTQMQYNYTNGKLWGCENGTWTQVSGGGGGIGYPSGTGIPQVVGGAAWGTTLGVGTSANNIPQLDSGGHFLPAICPLATSGAFGCVKVDGTTITASGGVISAVGGGGGNAAQYTLTTTATTITYSGAGSLTPIAIGTTGCTSTVNPVLTISGSGSGLVYGYADTSCNHQIVYNSAITVTSCTNCTATPSATPAIPPFSGAAPVFVATVATGAFQTPITNFQSAIAGAPSIACSTGMLCTPSSNTLNQSVDQATVDFKFSGSGAPGSVAGNKSGDTYLDTSGHNAYMCGALPATAAPACTSVTSGGWFQLNGSGGSPVLSVFGTCSGGAPTGTSAAGAVGNLGMSTSSGTCNSLAGGGGQGWPATRSCTIQNVQGYSSAAGSATDTIVIWKNSSATSAICSFSGTTACSISGSTGVSLAAGDVVRAIFSNTSTSISNVGFSFECQ